MPGVSDLFRLSFVVDGQVQLDRLLGVMRDRVQDLSGVWADIHKDFLQAEDEQFQSEGGSGSGGWAALSPAYAAWKESVAPGRPILVLSGALRESLARDGAPGHVYQPGRMGVTMGTTIEYAHFHQRGTSQMPSRPPIELTERQKRLWPKLVQEYIVKSGQVIPAQEAVTL